MPRRVYSFRQPARFVVGTVGLPGERTFYLQARGRQGEVVSVAVEKVQVSALTEGLEELLVEAARRGGGPVPQRRVGQVRDRDPLESPVVEDFRASRLTLTWVDGTVVVEAAAPPAAPDTEPEDEAVLRVELTPGAVREFAERARAVLAAGRPTCVLCFQPADPLGHACPRLN